MANFDSIHGDCMTLITNLRCLCFNVIFKALDIDSILPHVIKLFSYKRKVLC